MGIAAGTAGSSDSSAVADRNVDLNLILGNSTAGTNLEEAFDGDVLRSSMSVDFIAGTGKPMNADTFFTMLNQARSPVAYGNLISNGGFEENGAASSSISKQRA